MMQRPQALARLDGNLLITSVASHTNINLNRSRLDSTAADTVAQLMSPTTLESAVVAVYKTDLVYDYCIFAVLTFVCYEFVITLEYEFEFLWQRQWTAATWLFIANRYLLLAATIPQATPFSAQMFQFCIHDVLECAVQSSYRHPNWYIFLYSAFGNSLRIASRTVFSALRVFAMLDPNLASSLTTIAADIAVIVTTWIKTYRQVKHAASVGMNAKFSRTLLEYGTLYFLVICAVNVANLLVFLIPSQSANPTGLFIATVPSIVLSRFLINLRQIDRPRINDATYNPELSVSNFHALTLSSILGNLGESLSDETRDSEAYQDRGDDISHRERKNVRSTAMHVRDGRAEVRKARTYLPDFQAKV
ncbi:hypothetical protein NM688_g4635 [Phlebia brevispora]|uniref:Uncharacterized protein n=1 Tax=Phlebia brevispora TaxID=194682 RepID=A0ACC1T228_9APHY|nr:hypothetical protein NM688_g4635 [Phlebia brevispora]